MDIIGLDLHKRESQLCIGHADGRITERRIVTSRERFTAELGDRPRARILLEAATESEWVAQHLEALGHEVIVADPNFAPMYATRSRRVKTDKRDARTLYEAAQQGTYRPAHRLSSARRHVRAELAVRDTLVRARTRCLALAKALVRRDGLRVPSSTSRLVMRREHTRSLGRGRRPVDGADPGRGCAARRCRRDGRRDAAVADDADDWAGHGVRGGRDGG